MSTNTTLTDLPPEILDHIANYLPTASSFASLSRTSRSLREFVEKDAWQTLCRKRFPSRCPTAPQSWKDASRSLTTLSRAWDRRAFAARYIEPTGHVTAFPGARRIDRWKRPKGQTIGFTPQLDVYEQYGSTWQDRREVLAFSAGAEVVLRERFSLGSQGGERESWMTYRPFSAGEGKDDVTSLHLLRPPHSSTTHKEDQESELLIIGTANADLQLLSVPSRSNSSIVKTYFTTQGQPVRSSSLLQCPDAPPLLAANLGDSKICLYLVDPSKTKIAPSSETTVLPPPMNGDARLGRRIWSTNFLSAQYIAVGLGPSEKPIAVYAVDSSDLIKEPVRRLTLQDSLDDRLDDLTADGVAKRPMSSVYPVLPLPPFNSATTSDGKVFLSGAYDGVIRLHDLRSDRDVEQMYVDPTDDSSIYSLLACGNETIVAGTSRHSLLKVFDLRLGAKCYSYLDANPGQRSSDVLTAESRDWNIFLNPRNHAYPGRGGGNNWARRSAESSVYTLASPNPSSPYLYAGVENAVAELSFTSVTDGHQDPVFFQPHMSDHRQAEENRRVLDLACYEQDNGMKLMTQRGVRDVLVATGSDRSIDGWDERWMLGS